MSFSTTHNQLVRAILEAWLCAVLWKKYIRLQGAILSPSHTPGNTAQLGSPRWFHGHVPWNSLGLLFDHTQRIDYKSAWWRDTGTRDHTGPNMNLRLSSLTSLLASEGPRHSRGNFDNFQESWSFNVEGPLKSRGWARGLTCLKLRKLLVLWALRAQDQTLNNFWRMNGLKLNSDTHTHK